MVHMQSLLKTMKPEYKLALVEKLCEDVLGTAAEGGLPLDGCCHGVIADALGVIALPDLQISAKAVAGGEEGDVDDCGDDGSQPGASQVFFNIIFGSTVMIAISFGVRQKSALFVATLEPY